MTNPIARWREEHVRFAKLLDVLEANLDRFHVGERPDYGLMLDVMRYMRHYADATHHPREDLAFAKVAQREPRSDRMVSDLVAEHKEIEESGEKLVEMLEGVLDEAILTREAVEKPGREYIERLRAHMHSEEVLFPFVAMWLGDDDWAAIDRQIPPRIDPLLAPEGRETYEALSRLVEQTGEGRTPTGRRPAPAWS
jgi:hemerythrin-like domain-containing protein